MLIRWATEKDLPAWYALATEVSEIFQHPADMKEAQKEYCSVCNNHPSPEGQYEIEINDKVWIVTEYPGQVRLFGKMSVIPISHALNEFITRFQSSFAVQSHLIAFQPKWEICSPLVDYYSPP